MVIRMVTRVFEIIFTLRFWKWFYAFLPIWIVVISQIWTIQIWGRLELNYLEVTSDQTGVMLRRQFGCSPYPRSFGVRFPEPDPLVRDLLAELSWKGDWEFMGVVKAGQPFSLKPLLSWGGRIGVRHYAILITWPIAVASVVWILHSRRKRLERLVDWRNADPPDR